MAAKDDILLQLHAPCFYSCEHEEASGMFLVILATCSFQYRMNYCMRRGTERGTV